MIVSDKGGGGDFELLEAGTHAAVCTQIIGIGLQETGFGMKEKVKIRFEIPAERVTWTDDDGKEHEGPAIIWATYTASLNERAILRKDLEGWRGRPFTAEELAGFDLSKLLDVPCLLSVIHNEAKNGKTYANINAISKLPKGMDAPKREGELVNFDASSYSVAEFEALPGWAQDLVKKGVANKAEDGKNTPPEPPAGDPGFRDDDIPF